MLEISKLERRWLKYKIKKILPYALVVTIITIIGLAIPFILSYQAVPTTTTTLKKDSVHVKIPSVSKTDTDQAAMVLEPSMHFIESMNPPSNPTTDLAVPVSSTTKPAPIQKTLVAPIASLPPPTTVITPTPVIKAPQPTIVKGKLTSIKRDDAAFDIHEIENRFKKNE